MNTQRINITLPEDLLQELSFEAPLGKRSEFIAKAVGEKLQKKADIQKQLQKSLKSNKSFYDTVSKEWEGIEMSNWPQE